MLPVVKTEPIFIFEFSVQFLNISVEYANNQFWKFQPQEHALFIFTVKDDFDFDLSLDIRTEFWVKRFKQPITR